MDIQELPFIQFCNILGDSVVDRLNPGCAWYASADRRVAARLFLDPRTERFRYSTYRFCHGGWVQRDSRGDEFLAEAELALFKALQKIVPSLKVVSDSSLANARPEKRQIANDREAAEAGVLPLETER
jgi:hypothetical protein